MMTWVSFFTLGIEGRAHNEPSDDLIEGRELLLAFLPQLYVSLIQRVRHDNPQMSEEIHIGHCDPL